MDNPHKKKGNSFASHLMWGLESGIIWWSFYIVVGRNGQRMTKVWWFAIFRMLDPSSFVFKHIFKSVSEYSKNTWLQEITGKRIKEAYTYRVRVQGLDVYTISSTKRCEGRQHLSCLLKFTQTQHQTYLNLYIRNTNFGKPYTKINYAPLRCFTSFFVNPL